MIEQFAKDVELGLSEPQKSLPSKYFYDKTGDALFIKIMHLPEYYLTRSEMEIFSEQTDQIIQSFDVSPYTPFELIELGAGDGTKTQKLLEALLLQGYQFKYLPIDISLNALEGLERRLSHHLNRLSVNPIQGDYFDSLAKLKKSHHKKIVLFLGSNLGNMPDKTATHFLTQLCQCLNHGDQVLMGLDLMKSADVILPAYDDRQGVTRDFNKNLLMRINRELGGEFNPEHFYHAPEYDTQQGIATSYLVSRHTHSVHIHHIGKQFHFESGEKIHTEISRKYNTESLTQLISPTQFQISHQFMDAKHYFSDYLLTKHEH